MSAPVVTIREFAPQRQAEYSLLVSELPGRALATVGVLLFDPLTDTLHVKLRRDWHVLADEEDAEVLAELETSLLDEAQRNGGAAVLARLEDGASHGIRVTDREAIQVSDFSKVLGDLYRAHVPAKILQFRTHLPRYSLAVAAGPFLSNPEHIEADEWVEAPADLGLDGSMFVARIQGQSMEPKIPDGSLCVFRRNVTGSRNGRLVLVRNSELADDNQYTVKRYRSERVALDEGVTLHTRIRLESLNPLYPSWDLDPEEDKYQVVAEFIRVLE
jgi:phage repressor protein C with HTH and peptisase S24 domain